MGINSRFGVFVFLCFLAGVALTACQRPTQLTGDDATDATDVPQVVSAGDERYFLSCLQAKGASQASSCRVGSRAATDSGHRLDTDQVFVWKLAAIFATDPIVIVQLICGNMNVQSCLRLLGIRDEEVERNRGGHCRFSFIEHHKFDDGIAGGCGGWNRPPPRWHRPPTPAPTPDYSFVGYVRGAHPFTCVPAMGDEIPYCTQNISTADARWANRCRKAGFQIRDCNCVRLCTGPVE